MQLQKKANIHNIKKHIFGTTNSIHLMLRIVLNAQNCCRLLRMFFIANSFEYNLSFDIKV